MPTLVRPEMDTRCSTLIRDGSCAFIRDGHVSQKRTARIGRIWTPHTGQGRTAHAGQRWTPHVGQRWTPHASRIWTPHIGQRRVQHSGQSRTAHIGRRALQRDGRDVPHSETKIHTTAVEEGPEVSAGRLSGPPGSRHREHAGVVHVRQEGAAHAEAATHGLQFDGSEREYVLLV